MAVFLAGPYRAVCACSREKCSDDCSFYRKYKPKPQPITNYDLFRAMSVEEMAEFLSDVVNDAVDNGMRVKGFLDTRHTPALWMKWLKMKCFESWRLSEE